MKTPEGVRRPRLPSHSLFLSLLLIAALSGCGPASTPAIHLGRTASYNYANGITFRYPAAWHRLDTPQYLFTRLAVLGYVGTVTLSNPCTRTPRTFACASFPRVSMRRSSVIARWSIIGLMSLQRLFTAERITGKEQALRIAGRRARLVTAAGGALQCPRGTTHTVEAGISMPGGRDVLEMTACLSAPIQETQAQALAMLRSLYWGQPGPG